MTVDGLGGQGFKLPMISTVQGDTKQPEDVDFQEGISHGEFPSYSAVSPTLL